MNEDARQEAPGEQCVVHKRDHVFCEKDRQALCWVCAPSRKHQIHTVVPTEEAAQEYQKIHGAIRETETTAGTG